MLHGWIDTPIGAMLARRDERGIFELHFPPSDAPADSTEDDAAFDDVREQLGAYFAGRLRAFDLPLDLRGTPFQQDVWRALQRIPYGATTTYAALAAEIGRPSAVRAVGAANGANPLPIVVPCHRVIGSGGSLTGFGGGLPVKRYLLDLETYGHELFQR